MAGFESATRRLAGIAGCPRLVPGHNLSEITRVLWPEKGLNTRLVGVVVGAHINDARGPGVYPYRAHWVCSELLPSVRGGPASRIGEIYIEGFASVSVLVHIENIRSDKR